MRTVPPEVQNGRRMKQAEGGARLFPGDALRLLPTGACVCDASGRILDCNDKAISLWGRKPAPGDTWEIMSHDPEGGGHFQAQIQQGKALSNAVLSLFPAGAPRLVVLANVQPIREDGDLAGSLITFHPCPDAVTGASSRLWDTLDALPAAIYTADADGRITFFNEAAAELWGSSPEIGSSLWCGSWRMYYPDGRFMPHDECPMAQAIRERRAVRGVEAILERPDGTRVAIMPCPTPLYDASGEFVGAVNMLVDVTHRKIAEERHILFARELNHRVKNALATVYAIAMQTLRYTESLDSFRESFSSRLLALSRAHDLLVRCQWQETPLKAILAEALSSFGSSRLDVDGASADFGPRATLTLAMTFHELVTNATRHGALSNADGKVSIGWTVAQDEDGETMVTLSWIERDGPRVTAPAGTGFGFRLINHNLMALGGSFQADFQPRGLRCTLRFPVINEAPGWPPKASAEAPREDARAVPASPGGPAR
jgi:PAS domain S-box-containing protein